LGNLSGVLHFHLKAFCTFASNYYKMKSKITQILFVIFAVSISTSCAQKSIEQNNEKMLTNEPHLLQQIPLQHLASMLAVTPRHLSRIRSKIR